jgi:CubicO group peptidase (beta-lactamase class C family)
VVETIAKEKFAEHVRRHVFEPAAMRHAQVDDVRATIPGLATGYEAGLREAPAFDPSNKVPGGGFVATAGDMAQYAIAVMTHRLVSRETTDAMWTRQTTTDGKETGYGLGWRLGRWGSARTVYHSGAQPGVSTLLYLVPERGCAVVFLTNRGGLRAITDVARGIAEVGCESAR